MESMHNPKRGFLSIFILAVVLLIPLVVGGAYFLYKSGKLPINLKKTSQQKAIEIVSEAELVHIQDSVLKKHFLAQLNKTSYRTKSTSSGRGNGFTVTEVELANGKTKIHTIENADGKDIAESIIIDGSIYVKDYTDNKWWIQSLAKLEQNGQPSEFPIEGTNEFIEKTKNLTYNQVGVEICGQTDCYQYQEIEEGKVARTFWFNDQDFLLRKEQFSFGEFLSTFEYSYDNIGIQEPSPAKDVPEGQNIYDLGRANENTEEESDLQESGEELDTLDSEEIPDIPE